MCYRYTEYDPDVCIKRVRKENGTDDYKCMLIYVDDVIYLAQFHRKICLILNRFIDLRTLLDEQMDISVPTSINYN